MSLASNSSASCGMVVDRHVAKNAGSTVRTMFQANQHRCRYLGYDVSATWKSRVGFEHKSFSELVSEVATTPKSFFCVEAHVVARSFWAEAERLHESLFAKHCRVVVMLRVREPLSWYRSFYDWAILPRQRGGDTRFGANFTDWLPSNLQSSVLLSATSSRMAVQLASRPSDRGGPRPLGKASWNRLMRMMRTADIVAPLERWAPATRHRDPSCLLATPPRHAASLVCLVASLDESLVLLRRLSGFLETSSYRYMKPPPMGGKWYRVVPQRPIQRAADLCAGADGHARCDAAVREAAPDDFRLHAKAVSLFKAQLAPWLADAAFLAEVRAHREF